MSDLKLSSEQLHAAASGLHRACSAVPVSAVTGLPIRGAATYENVTDRIDAFFRAVETGMAELSISAASARASVIAVADTAKQTDNRIAHGVGSGGTATV